MLKCPFLDFWIANALAVYHSPPRQWESWHCICRQRRRSVVPKGGCHCQHGKCSLRDQQFSWLSSWWSEVELLGTFLRLHAGHYLIMAIDFFVKKLFWYDNIILIMRMKIYEAFVRTLHAVGRKMRAQWFVQFSKSLIHQWKKSACMYTHNTTHT